MVNLLDLHIHAPLLYSTAIIWPVVCIAVVCARFATRNSQTAKVGPDDWLMLPSLVLIIGMAVTVLAGTAQQALGQPSPKPVPGTEFTAITSKQTITRKAYLAGVLLNIAALTFIKLSCIFVYKRIFAKGSNITVTTIIWTINAIILLWGIGYFFAFLFGCGTHFNYFWTNIENQLKCPADLAMIQKSLAISDVIMDGIILIFPIPLIMRLQMSNKNKFAVLAIFALGALSVAASIVRLVIILQGLESQFAATADEDFVSTAGLYFMYNEASFALIAVCLPSLSGAFKLKGVQIFVDGFTAAFSNLSLSSIKSRGSHKSASKSHERLGSIHSGRKSSIPNSERPSHGGSDIHLEEYPISHANGIIVTSQVDQNFSQK